MTEQDREAFGVIMAGLGELFPPMELTPSVLAMYWKTLSDLDIRTVERAAIEAARVSTFFPKPAELRKCAFTRSARVSGPEVKRLEHRPTTNDHGREALALTKRILLGDLAGRGNIGVRIVALWAMHERWPAFGWDDAAREAEGRQELYREQENA